MYSTKKSAVYFALFGALCLSANQKALAQSCPEGATDIGPGSSAGARLLVNGQPLPIPAEGVGVCSIVRLGGTIRYDAQGTFGPNVAFEGGQMRIFSVDAQGNQIPGFDVNVTPPGGVPLIGPPECSSIQSLNSVTVDFDIASHLNLMGPDRIIRFRFLYGPQGTIAHTDPRQFNVVTKGDGIQVLVAPAPACTASGDTVCPASKGGSPADLTVTATGSGPLTYAWRKGCPGAGAVLSTSATFSFPAELADAGCYEVTVTDQFGCTTTCRATLVVNDGPTCTISPPSASKCAGESQQFCVNPAGGTPPYAISWTKNGAPFAGNVNCINAVASVGTDTYVARVQDSLGCVTTCQATLTGVPCLPRIEVVKEVVCWLPTGCAPFDGSKTATAAKGTNCPAFCYRITVFNRSDPGIELRNLVITDDSVPNPDLNLSGCGFPPVLPPGGSASCVIERVEHCDTTVNVVTATAEGFLIATATSVGPVSDTDTNTAVIKPIDVTCTKTVSVDGAAPVSSYIFTDNNPHSLVYIVNVCNPAPPASVLPIVAMVSDPVLQGLGIAMPAPFSLAPGECREIRFDPVTLTCTNLENTITVDAVVDTSRTNVCVYDRNSAVIGENTTCGATLICQPTAGCRTTGGGKQLRRTGHVDPRKAAQWVTHGGQVGAPVGTATAFSPDSECIHGRWTHVRHIGPGLDGNFHARSFDSLMCACLGCPEVPGSGVVIGGLCNPDDRVCGPEPRKAPANKITFSGVGNYAVTKGRRTPRSVVFRVDIEDRSEPGGSPPGQGNKEDPPDRYRIRIWMITGDANSPANMALRQAVAASEANVALKDGVADGQRALGTAVFGVRAPDIDDGGEMDRGNHQIHPQIKDCP